MAKPKPLKFDAPKYDHIERPPAKPHLLPILPNPGVTTNGRVFCNAVLAPGVYCGKTVRRDKGWHRGKHRVEWYSRG